MTTTATEAWRDERERQARALLRTLRSKSKAKQYGWGEDMTVEAGLLLEGFRFEFVQAVRLLSEIAKRMPAAPTVETVEAPATAAASQLPQVVHAAEETLLQEPPHASASLPALDQPHSRLSVRLRSRVAFDFPPASVHSVRLSTDVVGQIEVIANLMALAGNNAPMPEPFGELILNRQIVHDMAMTDFLDIFHHRLLELYYTSTLHTAPWLAMTHPAVNELAQMVFAVAGLGPAGLRHRMAVPDRTWLRYAGLLWHRPRSAAALAQILSDHFKVSVRLGEAVGRWFAVEDSDRCRVGTGTCVLGQTATLGNRVWLGDAGILLHIGPLDARTLTRFLPGAALYTQLQEMLRFYIRDNITADLQLHMKPEAATAARVGSARLGWTSWLRPQSSNDLQRGGDGSLSLRVRHAA